MKFEYLQWKPLFDQIDQWDHINNPNCWCEPELEYEDPETGSQVWVHREIH